MKPIKNISILGICMVVMIFPTITHGATQPPSYEDYKKDLSTSCNSESFSWGKNNSLVPRVNYPELNTNAIRTFMEESKNNPQSIDAEKIRIKNALDSITIGNFSGFKTLEIARVRYRSTMNSLFACGLIQSKIQTIDSMQKLIEQKIKNPPTELKASLKKIQKTLENQKNTIACNTQDSYEDMLTKIINSATLQYCHYHYYLEYLNGNVSDIAKIQSIEEKLGEGNGTQKVQTTKDWVQISNLYTSSIRRELIRAESTLPRAIKTFTEMDRTYGVHILLTIIYDDYIKLRKAAGTYMNISSQLYQKAHNAQSTNK